MRNRILKKPIFKTRIKQGEIDQIKSVGEASKELLENPQFAFLIEYLSNSKKYILEVHAKQSLHDIEEQYTVGDRLRKLFVPASKEYTLMAGEYRFIDKLMAMLRSNVEVHAELENKIKKNLVEIQDE